jgi:hypothetical protein
MTRVRHGCRIKRRALSQAQAQPIRIALASVRLQPHLLHHPHDLRQPDPLHLPQSVHDRNHRLLPLLDREFQPQQCADRCRIPRLGSYFQRHP